MWLEKYVEREGRATDSFFLEFTSLHGIIMRLVVRVFSESNPDTFCSVLH